MAFSPRKLEGVLKDVNKDLLKEGVLSQRDTQDLWTKLMSNLLQGEYAMALPIRQDLQTHVRKKRPDKIYTFNKIIHRLDEILDRYIPAPDLNAIVLDKPIVGKAPNKTQNSLLLPAQPHVLRTSVRDLAEEEPLTKSHKDTKREPATHSSSNKHTDSSVEKTDITIERNDTFGTYTSEKSSNKTDKKVTFNDDERLKEQRSIKNGETNNVLKTTVEDQQIKIKRLEETIHVLEKKNTVLQEEIKTISEIKGDKIDVFSKAEREIKFLRNELKIKEKTLQLSLIERNELLDKLGSVTTSKFANGNTGVTDLSDINKPTLIADKYDKLYHSEWTDCFHMLTMEMKEEKLVIQWLLDILNDAYWYCLSTNESHTKLLMENLVFPFRTSDATVDPLMFNDVTLQLLIDLKKSTAQEPVSQIQVHFLKTMQKSKKPVYEAKTARKLMTYIDTCVELCWYMVNQSPVVVLDDKPVQQGDDFDRDAYRFYGKSGSKLDYLVWPALFIQSRDGYMLHQGVAQAKQEGVALRIASSHSRRLISAE